MTAWLDQTPLFYSPSHGAPMKFRLLFKSDPDQYLATEIKNTAIFSLGNNWFSPWRAYLKEKDGSGGYFYFNGLGGTISITNGGAADYRSRVTCGADGGSNPTINYTSGAVDTFGFSDGNGLHFLSQKQDAFGNITTYSWTNDSGVIKLAAI